VTAEQQVAEEHKISDTQAFEMIAVGMFRY